MANVVYNAAKKYLLNGSVNLASDTVKGMLVTSSYTPNASTNAYRSDVTNEVVGTGYTAGGAVIASPTVTQDNPNNRAIFAGANPSWPSSTITAAGMVLYKSRGGASTADELIGYLDFGGNVTSTNGTFTVQFNAVGILTLT